MHFLLLQFLLDCTLLSPERFYGFMPSRVAAAAVWLMRKVLAMMPLWVSLEV